MKIFLITLLIGTNLATAAPAPSSGLSSQEVLSTAKKFSDNADDLGLRLLARKLLNRKLSLPLWLRLRDIFNQRPAVGWDVLRAWDHLRPKLSPAAEKGYANLESQLAQADTLMLQKKFQESFDIYQSIAKSIKSSPNFKQRENYFLYQSVLHAMARALFGAGHFNESVQAYSWIGPLYPKLRQVYFEKMWAALRAGKIDVANGAIASQASSYFSSYLAPETYLVQIYIYKKLCRNDELQLVLSRVKNFQANLKANRYTIEDWAKSDFDTMAMLQLLHQSRTTDSNLVSNADRDKEKQRIRAALQKSFDEDKKLLVSQLDSVIAYSTLAFSLTTKDFPSIQKLPNPAELSKSGLEFWPVQDGEDWLDEFGKHLFIGDSQCAHAGTKKQ